MVHTRAGVPGVPYCAGRWVYREATVRDAGYPRWYIGPSQGAQEASFNSLYEAERVPRRCLLTVCNEAERSPGAVFNSR